MEENMTTNHLPSVEQSRRSYGRLSPTKTLPTNTIFYHRFVMANWKFNLVLNGGSILLLIISGWVFLGLAIATKPQYAIQVFIYLVNLPLFLSTLVGVMVLHELCHFLGYWYFSKQLPRIGFKLLYPHADGSKFYFPRDQFVIATLLPFVAMTTIGLLWLFQANILLIPTLILALAINTAGSLGDIILSAWLLSHPRETYVDDEGGSIAIYRIVGDQ